MNPGNKPDNEILETDIVVIGGGGSGLSAAVAAAQKGARVTLLERRRSLGGNSKRALGIFAAESPLQRRLRIDTSRDVCFQLAMAYSHNKINPRIFRAFVNKSGDTVRWLQEQGLKFFDVPSFFPGQLVRTWHCPKGGGAAFINILIKSGKALGVQLITQARAKRLLLDEKGNVAGILATRKGEPLQIKAKSVVIATGGYAGNKKLIAKYYPLDTSNMFRIGLPHTGDGLQIVTGIGADTEGLGTLQMTGPGFPGSLPLSYLAKDPNAIWINKKGERFIDERAGLKQFEGVNAMLRQPDQTCFTVFDFGVRQFLIENGLTAGRGLTYREQRVSATAWVDDFQKEVGKGTVKTTDSWDEMADWMGVDSAVLKATIEDYNMGCDTGYDPIYGKSRSNLKPLRTPPYYALRCYPGLLTTIGGIKINEYWQVIGKNDRPIPGLYAGGNDTGGWVSDTYDINLAGVTFGYAINSGRIAGENAAKFVLEGKP
ncbi:MAG TPA: FAD-dependent oxidoreductase [Dehalococcoidia bacterium]|nr:FAD-dependent oxidoreductase [Dehalococcoidia bacterium]